MMKKGNVYLGSLIVFVLLLLYAILSAGHANITFYKTTATQIMIFTFVLETVMNFMTLLFVYISKRCEG